VGHFNRSTQISL